MRKMIFALMLAAAVLLPSIVLAGQGATTFYGIFHHTNHLQNIKTNSITWIVANNRNDYAATVKITYYNYSGTAYHYQNGTGETTFTHTVTPNATVAWTPQQDLDWDNQQYGPLGGSYVVKVTEGSINLRSNLLTVAGDLLYDNNYNVGDVIGSADLAVHTVTSTNLNLVGFNFLEIDEDGRALYPGERNARIDITNPSDDQDATVRMKFYENDGTAVEIDPHDTGDTTTYTFTLTPHQDRMIGADLFFPSPATLTTYNVNFDVTKGSVTGNYVLHECRPSTTDPSVNVYTRFGGALTKQLIIQ